jgi:hypothetical protein
MSKGRLIAVVASMLAVVAGLSTSNARQAPGAPAPRPLDPGVTAVRLVLGIGDQTPKDWSGRVDVDKGEVVAVEGVRFREGDEVVGRDAWKTRSCEVRKVATKKAAMRKAAMRKAAMRKAAMQQGGAPRPTGPSTFGAAVFPNGVIVSIKNAAGATLSVETEQGKFQVPLERLADGSTVEVLDGRAASQRVFPHTPLVEGPLQQDFPAAVADGQDGAWIVYVEHLPFGPDVLPALDERPKDYSAYRPGGGGDRMRIVHFRQGHTETSMEITDGARDVWRPAIARDGDGNIVVAWTEKHGEDWEIFARRFNPKTNALIAEGWLTERPGADAEVALATASDGVVWMAWQAWIGGQSDILLAPIDASGKLGAKPIDLSDSPGSEWAPSIAADGSGRIHIAYDSYASGNYDVMLRSRGADGRLAPPIKVAGSTAYEARPTIAADARGRVWIAYEERSANWGKDAVNLIQGPGSSLYREAKVAVVCVDGTRVLSAADPVEHAPAILRPMNSYPRIAVDRDGRPWLTFRHRQEAIWGNNAVMVVGAVWIEYATSLSASGWSPPRPLTRSDGTLDCRPALVQPQGSPMLAFYSTDGRLRREVLFTAQRARQFNTNQGTMPQTFNVDLEVSALVAEGPFQEPSLGEPGAFAEPVPDVHPEEAEDLKRMRGYRVEAAGKTYRLLRGEFHRHSELSADGGADGSLEDLWRYAIDAAGLEWIGDGDHDNGGGKEYTWWLVQKTTDLYTHSPTFTPMYSYERSNAYPHGHRNVMFARRGVRTLPRLVGPRGVLDEDTLMLYDYLKEHDGICASHTSATGMGTDWRDTNPQFEPIVEIYQGHRQSYEYLGAPRGARRPGESIGGWQPLGMVWNALAMQYRLGFQASSDHVSTHISYAVALAEDTTREAILDAFRKRHCYAATDNIIMDVRSGEHLMGDEFRSEGPVKLQVRVEGTRPIARVDIIKDFRYAYSTEPKAQRVSFQWTDDEKGRPAGLSWYYVRAIQDDGQLAWASPMWVHLPAVPAANEER